MKKEVWQKPIFFERNRVFRIYLGGELFREFLGDAEGDGFYPEEWISSAVRAINPGHTDPLEGISLTREGNIPLSRLLEEHPREILGQRESLGVLVKFLDSAIRLPMQVHPSRADAQKLFGSPYGKTEAWLILKTRPDACIYYGLKDKITRQQLEAAVDNNRTDRDSFLGLVNRIPVKEGDVFFVPAGVIHAIGAGCLLLEAQEPTDFTIQPEYYCGDYALNDQEMYLGLPREQALGCFDLEKYGPSVVEAGTVKPLLLKQEPGVEVHSLIGPHITPCFSMTRYTLTGGAVSLTQKACVYIVVSGQGVLSDGEETQTLKQGDYFLMPACAENYHIAGNVQFVCCEGELI